ncbi:MAG: helix-turn-helix domain-containing protein [Haliscomenobacteraceae bacterium CHB4]|nr:HTH-type transcriptional regulator CdhR [Saprospiraceae bacterium]MCE7924337.1 helix-turn-helix domain-containing protein [Haliscomenobacteraceae bacterium CHB4]
MKQIRIVFFLFPKTHLLDLSGPAQVFYEANQISGQQHFQIVFAGADGTIRTEQGPVFTHITCPDELALEKGDFVCVPGFDFLSFTKGELDEAICNQKAWFRQQHKKGVCIGSICSGALALARMGLLDQVQCTTHWKCLHYAQSNFPKARFLNNRLYVMDKEIFTSAGMTAGIDMALALVDKWCSPLLAAKVAQEMVINVRRAETKDQQNIFLDFDNHFNAEVYRAQEILANRLDARFTVGDLAKMMNLSVRHLARLFKRHTGHTIQAYRDRLRLQHGEQLLLNTEMFVKEIAVACGYESSRQFVRLWKKEKGMGPEGWRRGLTAHYSQSPPHPPSSPVS